MSDVRPCYFSGRKGKWVRKNAVVFLLAFGLAFFFGVSVQARKRGGLIFEKKTMPAGKMHERSTQYPSYGYMPS